MIMKEWDMTIQVSSKFSDRKQIKRKLCKHRTDDKETDGVGFVIPKLTTQEVDPSAKVTKEEVVWDWKVDTKLELLVVPEWITHIEVEARQEEVILELLIVVAEELVSLNYSLYWENWAKSSVDTKIVFSYVTAIW